MSVQLYTRIHRHSNRLLIAPLTLILLFVNLAYVSLTCIPGLKSPGVTVPSGDIVLEYGSHKPLEITCILDLDSEYVKHMFRDSFEGNETLVPSERIKYFKKAENIEQSNQVSVEYVTTVNATAVRLFVPDPPAGQFTYYCMLFLNYGSTLTTMNPSSLETSESFPLKSGESLIGVCLNIVFVGYKPLHITNFSCISYNWDDLRCNWTKPQNPVFTNYKITFRLIGHAESNIEIECPNYDDVFENTCYWDSNTKEIYRKPYECCNFTLTGKNVLGTTNTSFLFHFHANVIPASPTNITVLDRTQSSVMLRWSVGVMYRFPPGLVHKIEYKSQWDSNPKYWHSVNVSDVQCSASLISYQTNPTNKNSCWKDKEYYYFNVTDLKYPFTNYDFRIYVRSSVAHGEDKWSVPGCISIKTNSTIPKRPPQTDVGSFECVTSSVDKSTRDIYIYWQQIDDSEKCGEKFQYRAYYTSVTADNLTIIHPSNETHKNYAKFDGLNTSIGYTFTIYSANEEGLSSEYSTVYVPSESNKLVEPLEFTKIAFDDRGVFELSWGNAINQKLFNTSQLYNYTIFWCEDIKDRPYQCDDYMNWVHVPSSESFYNVTLVDHMKNYQFAISANSIFQPISSGMVWASCTVLHNKTVGKIKNIWIDKITSTMMELRWTLDCSDRVGAVLREFNIFYCPVVSINNSSCKGKMLNKTVMTQDINGIVSITNLKPYTTYNVTINSNHIAKYREGLHSDPLLITTSEGAPDIHDLKINTTDLTNTSVTLKWFPPKFKNGIIRNYHIHFYQTQQDQQEESLDEHQSSEHYNLTTNETKFCLDQLESYTKYKITVAACTTICSNHSFPLLVQTAIGLPGSIPQPSLQFEKSSTIIVSWARPLKPGGPIDYYEFMEPHYSRPTNSIANVSSSPTTLASKQIQANVFHTSVHYCNDEIDRGQQTFSFIVRAVNKNPLDPKNPYYGPWSSPVVVSCVSTGFTLFLKMKYFVIWACLFIVLITVSTYWGKRFRRKYKIMHNVQLVLPPTFNVYYKLDNYKNLGQRVGSKRTE